MALWQFRVLSLALVGTYQVLLDSYLNCQSSERIRKNVYLDLWKLPPHFVLWQGFRGRARGSPRFAVVDTISILL